MFRYMLAAAVLIAAGHSPASARWLEAKSRHFIIYSEQSPKELREFAEELEQFDKGVRLVRAMDDPDLTESGRLKIFVLRKQSDVAVMAGADPSSGIHGYYRGKATGPLAFIHSEQPRDPTELGAKMVLLHEYTHHLQLASTNLALPLWMTEGTAEFFATARKTADGSLMFGAPPQHRAYGVFQLMSLSVEEMVGVTNPKLEPAEREQVYARGWLLVHMLVFDKARAGQLNAYVANIQKGMTALDAAKAAFGDLGKLSRDLAQYQRQNKFAGFAVPAAKLQTSAVAVRELSEAESAIMPTIMRSENGVDAKLAQRVLDGARKVQARYPDDPVVLAALAEAEQDAGNDAAAVAAADKASTGATAFKAMTMKARALLSMARKDPAKTDWTALRALIGKVNRLDPDAAEPLLLYYQTYAAQGIAPTKNAVEGLLYAQQLVPQDDALRMVAVRQMISDSKLAEARRLFSPLANDPHVSAKNREFRTKLMALLTAGDGKGALAFLDEEKKKTEAEAKKKS